MARTFYLNAYELSISLSEQQIQRDNLDVLNGITIFVTYTTYMINIMKKLALFLICLAVGITTSFAQRAGDSSLGLNLNYASETSFGLGARYQYNLTDNVRIEPEFNYYFKHDYCSYWDLGANVSYLFSVASDVTIYPLVGLGYMHGKFQPGGEVPDYSDGSFQAKIGAGVEFKLLPTTKLIIEPKYQFNDFENQFIITAGIAYCF